MIALELAAILSAIAFFLYRAGTSNPNECPMCHAELEWCACDLMLELEEPAFRRFGEEDGKGDSR